MLHAATVIFLLSQPMQVKPELVSLFEDREFRHSPQPIRYRLFIPETSVTKLPLIVWLHGRGEAGNDNVYQLRWLDQLVFHPPWDRGDYPFYLLAVQCPSGNEYWRRSDPSTNGEDMIDIVFAITQEIAKKFPIDSDAISVAGLSSGGLGCFELAMRYPDVFCAVAPMASGPPEFFRLHQLIHLPVWAFNSAGDATTPIGGMRETSRALSISGGTVKLTEVDTSDHNCWTAAFKEHRLLDWLLAQRRGLDSYPPGILPASVQVRNTLKTWHWWQYVVQGLVVAFLAITAWSLGRRLLPAP